MITIEYSKELNKLYFGFPRRREEKDQPVVAGRLIKINDSLYGFQVSGRAEIQLTSKKLVNALRNNEIDYTISDYFPKTHSDKELRRLPENFEERLEVVCKFLNAKNENFSSE